MLENLMIFDGPDLYNFLSVSFLLVWWRGIGRQIPASLHYYGFERPSGATLGDGPTSRFFAASRCRNICPAQVSKPI